MGKIVCDICGTSYPDTEDRCPVCGLSRELNGTNLLNIPISEMDEGEPSAEVISQSDEEVFKTDNAPVEEQFEVDESELSDDDYEEDDEDDVEEDELSEEPRSNTLLIIILVTLIVALLVTTCFIFFKYFLPNRGGIVQNTEDTHFSETTEAATTEARVPCTSLVLVSDASVLLEHYGDHWLINAVSKPDDTTDKILFASSDESVVTVNEAGKLTAVSEGEAIITVSCGEQEIVCKVTCAFVAETTESEKTTVAPSTSETDEDIDETEPEETSVPKETASADNASSEPSLTLKRTDLSFGKIDVQYKLEILEDIDPKDVSWSSENSNVVTIKDGVLTIVGKGQTKVIAEYNGMKAECIIRVSF